MFVIAHSQSVHLKINKNTIVISGALGSVEIDRSTVTGLLSFRPNKIICSNLQTYRILDEKIRGVQHGYLYNMELHGLGFRVHSKNQILVFKLGFSHTIHYALPNDVFCFVQNSNTFSLFGIDKKKLSFVAGQMKLLKMPDSYKAKGIRRATDIIHLKSITNKN
jgi:large subunit ribosomal protein L6